MKNNKKGLIKIWIEKLKTICKQLKKLLNKHDKKNWTKMKLKSNLNKKKTYKHTYKNLIIFNWTKQWQQKKGQQNY